MGTTNRSAVAKFVVLSRTKKLFGTINSDHTNPSIAIDSANNVHVVWAGTNATLWHEVWYAMLDPTGGTLIAETMLTADDGERSKHATVNVDSQDRVHVVWSDARENLNLNPGDSCRTGAGDILYMQLDPSGDDRSGDAAILGDIQVIADTTVSGGGFNWYPWSTLGADGLLHITWVQGGLCCDSQGFGSDLYHATLDIDDPFTGVGNSAPQLVSSQADGQSSNQYGTVATNGGSQVIWAERFGGDVLNVVARQVGAMTDAAATGTGDVTVSFVPSNGGRLVSAESLALADLPAAAQATVPMDATFDDGFFRIVIDGVSGPVNVVLTVPTAFDAATDIYYKWDAVNGWQAFPATNGVDFVTGVVNMNEIVLTLTDGGPGDADGVVNGQIVDPGGPGQVTPAAPPPAAPPPAAPPSAGSAPPQTSDDNWFGCSTGSGNGPADPTLPLLLLIAVLNLSRRHWMRAWQG